MISIRTFINRGYAKSDIGDHEGAIKDLTSAIEINPKMPMHIVLGDM